MDNEISFFFQSTLGVCQGADSVDIISDIRVCEGNLSTTYSRGFDFFAFHADPGPTATLRWRHFFLRNSCRSWFGRQPKVRSVRCRRTCVYWRCDSLSKCLLSKLHITFMSPSYIYNNNSCITYLLPTVFSVIRTALLCHPHLHVPLQFSFYLIIHTRYLVVNRYIYLSYWANCSMYNCN